MMSRTFVILVVFAAALLAGPAPVLAQTAGSLRGTVTSRDGEPLIGSTVEVTGPGVTRTVVAGTRGDFSVLALPPGTYTVTASDTGFKSASRTIEIRAAEQRTLEIQLDTEEPSEEIIVRTDLGFLGRGTNDLFIDTDTGTRTDLFNGIPERTTTIDNTAAARRDLIFSEDFKGVRLEPVMYLYGR